ncbi:MAG: NnrU family protein [Burkholderiaceae bacterium]
MNLLVIGLVLFLGVHSVRIVADTWRRHTISRIGLGAWKAAYALLALAGLVLIVLGWQAARTAPQVLWMAPVWMKHAAALLTLIAFVLVAAAYVPGNSIKAAVGHPMVTGVKVWALAHVFVNGTLAGTVLFGAFLVWSIVDYVACRRRDRRDGVTYPRGPILRTVIAVVLGVVAWAAFAFWLHPMLIGVAPMGRY